MPVSDDDRVRVTALGGFILLLAGFLAAILWACDGHFLYTLDDPYIHLALARNLPGHYGVSLAESAASSSSILYPWLLLPFAHAGFVWAPLVLNLLAAVLCFSRLLWFERQIGLTVGSAPAFRVLGALFFAGIINLYALPFMGMEHTLHVLTALAVLSGLFDVAEKRRPPVWFWLALVAGPLLRFEALALSGAALLCLFCAGYRRAAAVVALLLVLPQLAHGAYLHHLGLPMLPGSALIKLGEAGPLLALQTATGWIILLLTLLLLVTARRCRSTLALAAGLAGVAHLLWGRFGWLDRYHAYLLAVLLLTTLYLYRTFLEEMAARLSSRHLLLGLFLLVCGLSSLKNTILIPAAAADIYRQPFQVARFVADDWRQPVGANDIGLLTWRNPDLVTDLYGLGSEAARQVIAARGGWTSASLPAFVADRRLGLLIIHERLFRGALAPEWMKVAELKLARPGVLIDDAIQFYLTNPAARAGLVAKLQAWQSGLPEGADLIIEPVTP